MTHWDKYQYNMNSTEEQAPLANSVDAAQSPHTPGHQKRSKKRRSRRRRHRQDAHSSTTPHHTSQETEGTQLNQARQNHSTFDRALHHRSQGGTGYGLRRDYQSTPEELGGHNIPESLLPSYAHSLARMGIVLPKETTPEPVELPLTDAQQQAWEEQQMRQAHEQDQQNPMDEDEESKG